MAAFRLSALVWLMAGTAHATVIVRQLDPTPEGWSIGLEGSYDDQSGSTEKRDYSAAFNMCVRLASMSCAPLAALPMGGSMVVKMKIRVLSISAMCGR